MKMLCPLKFIPTCIAFLWGSVAYGYSDQSFLVYSTNPEYRPYDWAVGSSTFDGASVELLNLILPEGVLVKPMVVPWKRAQIMAANGEIDLLLSIRETPERDVYLQFMTHRAFPNPIVIFANKETNLTLKNWDCLKGHLGGVSLGDFFGGGFDEYWKSNLQVDVAKDAVANFKKLDDGRIEWFATGLYTGQDYLLRNPPTHPVVELNPPVSNGDIYFAFSKKSKWLFLLPEMSNRLEGLDRGGKLEALLRKYLGK